MANYKETKKRKRRIGEQAHMYILTSFNNIIVTGTDLEGNVFCWSSSGKCGFKGARKSTPHACRLVIESVAKQMLEREVRAVKIFVKGPGSGREAIRVLETIDGLRVIQLTDKTRIPHNGCTRRKERRA